MTAMIAKEDFIQMRKEFEFSNEDLALFAMKFTKLFQDKYKIAPGAYEGIVLTPSGFLMKNPYLVNPKQDELVDWFKSEFKKYMRDPNPLKNQRVQDESGAIHSSFSNEQPHLEKFLQSIHAQSLVIAKDSNKLDGTKEIQPLNIQSSRALKNTNYLPKKKGVNISSRSDVDNISLTDLGVDKFFDKALGIRRPPSSAGSSTAVASTIQTNASPTLSPSSTIHEVRTSYPAKRQYRPVYYGIPTLRTLLKLKKDKIKLVSGPYYINTTKYFPVNERDIKSALYAKEANRQIKILAKRMLKAAKTEGKSSQKFLHVKALLIAKKAEVESAMGKPINPDNSYKYYLREKIYETKLHLKELRSMLRHGRKSKEEIAKERREVERRAYISEPTACDEKTFEEILKYPHPGGRALMFRDYTLTTEQLKVYATQNSREIGKMLDYDRKDSIQLQQKAEITVPPSGKKIKGPIFYVNPVTKDKYVMDDPKNGRKSFGQYWVLTPRLQKDYGLSNATLNDYVNIEIHSNIRRPSIEVTSKKRR